MSRRRLQLAIFAIAFAVILVLAAPPGASASGVLGSGVGPNVGPNLNPFPSVGSFLGEVVNGLFGALLAALTPGFLRHADTHTLEWLVALPNVADASVWPTVGHLQADMVWVAGAMLPTTLVIAATRDTALSFSFRAHPGNALLRVVGAVFWLVLYRFSVENAVAFVNVLTHTMLSWPVVAQGLHRTVLVMFGGSLITGAGGAFLGLLGLIALVFAVCLFALKVLLLMVLAVLFVAGPLLIALTPLPVVGELGRGWLVALLGICMIPVGWCIIFATAGAISLDVTNLGGGAHIGSRVVGAFAALATFYIAFKWPLMVLGHVRAAIGGIGVRTGGAGAGSLASDGALAAKAQRARVRLQAAMLAGGRGVGLAAGALGAPRGGLAGLAARQLRPNAAAAAAGAGAVAMGQARPGPRARGRPQRRARAREILLATPARMRAAWRAVGKPPDSRPGSGRRGRPRSGRAGWGESGAARAPATRGPRARKRFGGAAYAPRNPSQYPRSPGRDPGRTPPTPSRAEPGNAGTGARNDGPRAAVRERTSAPANPRGASARPGDQGQAGRRAPSPQRPARADAGAPRPSQPPKRDRPSAPRQPRPRKGRRK